MVHLAANEFFARLKRHCLHSAYLVIIKRTLVICQTDMHHCLADEIHGVKPFLILHEDNFDTGKLLR